MASFSKDARMIPETYCVSFLFLNEDCHKLVESERKNVGSWGRAEYGAIELRRPELSLISVSQAVTILIRLSFSVK